MPAQRNRMLRVTVVIVLLLLEEDGAVMTPSWQALSEALPSLQSEPLSVLDGASLPSIPKNSQSELIFYREKQGWCPYSERVWLTLELGNLPFKTILIDNTHGTRPSWFSGTTPGMDFGDNKIIGESMDIVRELDRKYNLRLRGDETRELVAAFRRIFPKNTRPSSRTAFLLKGFQGKIPRKEIEDTLAKTDELLAESDGPFFAGNSVSVADIAWAPFLERYAAQLPVLYHGLCLRSYSHINTWLDAMDTLPPYWARIKGDDHSWRKLLLSNFEQQDLVTAPLPFDIYDEREQVRWQAYGWDRDGIGRTPRREAATRIIRNAKAIVADATRQAGLETTDAELGLRRFVAFLLEDDDNFSLASNYRDADTLALASQIATYLEHRLCVPRDMGAPPAQQIRRLISALSSTASIE